MTAVQSLKKLYEELSFYNPVDGIEMRLADYIKRLTTNELALLENQGAYRELRAQADQVALNFHQLRRLSYIEIRRLEKKRNSRRSFRNSRKTPIRLIYGPKKLIERI